MKTTSAYPKVFLTLSLSLMLFFSACKKETSDADLTPQEQEEAAIASAESEAEADAMSNDVFDDVIGVNAEVGLGGTGIFGRTMQNGRVDSMPSCVNINIIRLNAPEPFPLKIVIDFGAGCQGRDGRIRSGKIISVYSGRLTVPGKSATTIFDGYKVGGISVQGTHKITNTGSTSQRQFTVDVEGAKLTKPIGAYVQWNSQRVITQIEGLGTPFLPADDIFSITGSSAGTVKRDNLAIVWESNITEPLIKRFTCRWFSKGTVKSTRTNNTANWVGILNYGTGECDNKAVLTVNGTSREITLH